MKVIIEKDIVYDSSAATLTNISSNKSITLTAPSNECLLIILTHGENITPQKYLFEQVWETHGLPINNNTFYQNISIIRKSFRLVGMEKQVIVTISRRGIKVAGDISISEFNGNKQVVEMEGVSEKTKPPRNYNAENLNSAQDENEFFINKKLILSGGFLCILFFLIFIFKSNRNQVDRLSKYIEIGKHEGCNVFYEKNKSEKKTEDVFNAMDVAKIRCLNNERVYFSSYSELPRESFIICNSDNNNNLTMCNSHYRYFSGPHYE
ncbi:winged helix-turn-helix domain-containing protein [Serratia liquefaciens]|uniref:winged helix-turn-helix domain-containing protein n=1 Tax=Serratia liquefaciens TaxID=614 RepID=UPI00235FDECF|nr:winged helix-turn-helix domain-containing protein [Serratia liquefaciens]